MLRRVRGCLVAMFVSTAWALAASVSQAAPMIAIEVPPVDGAGGIGGGVSFFQFVMRGWDFQVNDPINVTALGVFDINDAWRNIPPNNPKFPADGLREPHNVGLWDSAGDLLGSVTVPRGTDADVVNVFRFEDLATRVALQAGSTYRIAASYPWSGNDAFLDHRWTPRTTAPEISPRMNYYSVHATPTFDGNGLERPTTPFQFGAVLGPNFLFEPGGGGIDIGNGATVDLDAGDILGDGVGTTELGAIHGLDAQSVAGTPRQDKSNQLDRAFTFGATGSDPVEVNFYGFVEGRLLADRGGMASVNITLELFDFSNDVLGTLLGSNDYFASITAGGTEFIDGMIFEELAFSAFLDPGGR